MRIDSAMPENETPPPAAAQPRSRASVLKSLKRLKRRKIVTVVVFAIVIGLMAPAATPFARNWWKDYQTKKMTARARELLRRSDPEGAFKALGIAYRYRPKDAEVLRLLGRSIDQTQADPNRAIS